MNFSKLGFYAKEACETNNVKELVKMLESEEWIAVSANTKSFPTVFLLVKPEAIEGKKRLLILNNPEPEVML